MNIFNEAGGLAISTRLQQLSDRFRKDGALIYESQNIQFQPKWFPVIYTLHMRGPLSINGLSEEISYSHPSTIVLLKELEKEGLIFSYKDEKDERKRMVDMTDTARALVKEMEPVWNRIRRVVEVITDNANNLLMAMEDVEYQLNKNGFLDRYLELTKTELANEIKIVHYDREYSKAFYDLNFEWISEIYEVEPEDEKVLSDPEQYYLKEGGAILMALYDGLPVGTCALKNVAEGIFELSKMAVTKTMRGKRIGELLGRETLNEAKRLGAKKVILYSNRQGSATGINLYKKLGFKEVELTGQNFKRADIKMEIEME